VIRILTLAILLLTGCTFGQINRGFERTYEDFAKTAASCADRAQYYAGRQTPQEVTSRCIASSGLSSNLKELPALP
jgi:hypothetical protein